MVEKASDFDGLISDGMRLSLSRKIFHRCWCPRLSNWPSSCAVVRCDARMLALTPPIAQTSLVLVESLLAEESMNCKRRENVELKETHVNSSASDIVPVQPMPFSQKITCTINEACEATSLGRTKLYELIGDGRLATTIVGRRRLVVVRSLLSLLEPNTSV
ncbi:MAG: hypothetical protein E6614_16075 [Bradyrhizobium sp.]|jgi:excisionase family DNA binding protein|uniref:Helix-turn-helix domain-containing protein n=1 Tax=Bradyrhizobium denitrificans TaxID=2734912 RepID=A0ABS5GB00_9BRAD|nr:MULTISPECIES: hypothetical protein [Bradyrhizobium]MBR1138515.1 hypothetical protein [Bradyrhizobium denitrificans]MDU0959042.1 hypothetical protein [Bradyrhizobium sp.]MDU1497333.1 hypothetical protein [Bradyrhizobium sp.]MDU1547426.1 hypothetical protein [Bradyrhizobium sp.]MDU1666990.1 hypothetical protein [Bradyrhizobium sp.]